MSSASSHSDQRGIAGSSGYEGGGDKKRLKLEPQHFDVDDDSGLDDYDDIAEPDDGEDGAGGDDVYNDDVYSAVCKDQRSLSERCFGPPFQYWVLNARETYHQMVSCITECQKILAHSPTTVRLLLNHRSWDIGKLYDDYYGSDMIAIFSSAGIPDPSITTPDVNKLPAPSDCDICFASLRPGNFCTAKCGHSFCNDCWRSYLLSKVMNSAGQEKIECPAQSCKCFLEDEFVIENLATVHAQEVYKKQITESYVQSNRRMCWCPGANCSGHVIELEQGSSNWCPVTCSCSHFFCFHCREQWHGPVTCKYLKKWNKKCADDSETVNWISVNTKRCPKCEAPIEKNGGCNHMQCSNTACRHHFCWICLGDWNSHNRDNYNCNRFPENHEEITSANAARENSLKRYLFYFDRYYNHHKSLKSENTLVEKIEAKIAEYTSLGVASSHDLYFMNKAVQVLCQCRQTLMYTYVFAYYLSRNNNATIFEDNQSDLQRATEELSEHLERDLVYEKEALETLKKIVMHKTNYCESRCAVLLKHVYEGYEEGYWTYIDSQTGTG